MVFVDPDAEDKASLEIVSAERLVIEGDARAYFHVRVGSRHDVSDRVRLSVEGPDGTFVLPLEDASALACGEHETCLSVTRAPGLPDTLTRLALDVPVLEHHHDAPLVVTRLGPYALSGRAEQGNTRISIDVGDPIRARFSEPELVTFEYPDGRIEQTTRFLFPRTFEATAVPGPCGLPASSEGAWTPLDGNPGAIAAELSEGERPEACVSVRPSLPREGSGVAAVSVEARARVTRYTHTYSPPVELAPLIFLPFFDLEISSESRCRDAEAQVGSAVLELAQSLSASSEGGAEVLALDAVELANLGGGRCRQADERRFDAFALANQVEAAIARAFGPMRRTRVLLVYASNLDVEPPVALASSFDALRDLLSSRSPARRDFLLTVAPQRASARLSPDANLPWLTAEDASLRTSIQDALRTLWPFKTVVHTEQTVVPLADAALRPMLSAFRICGASESVVPIGDPVGPTVLAPGPAGPAYTAPLAPAVLVTSKALRIPSITVDWEGCTGLCDHPAPGDESGNPWKLSVACP